MKQAVALVENDDKTIENRRKANLNVSDWEWTWKSVYTYDELEKMSQSDYNRVKGLQLQWKVKFKN
jgi:Zn/Cd-binding protein ZinT